MTGRELVKLLIKEGWAMDHISGSHYIMRKEGFRPVPVPVHGSKDLKKGTLNGILKQAGLK